MKEIGLRKLQLLQLEALNEVDRICKNHHIKYYMISGTLIGAVRHKGFIPWDDDIDIAMMRRDYDKFLSCCSIISLDKYFLQNYQTDQDFYPALTRLCIKDTYLDDQYSRHLNFNKGAYIDIHPIDNVPDDEELLNKQENKLRMIDRLMRHKACFVYRNGPLFTILIAKKILKVLLFPISLDFLHRCRERAMKEYSKLATSRVCCTASKYGYRKQVMQQSIYGEPILLEFEGSRYYAPQNWHEYLKQTYGDYMAFPSEDQRKSCFVVYEV